MGHSNGILVLLMFPAHFWFGLVIVVFHQTGDTRFTDCKTRSSRLCWATHLLEWKSQCQDRRQPVCVTDRL